MKHPPRFVRNRLWSGDSQSFSICDEVDFLFAGSDVKLLAEDDKADLTLT